MVVGEGAESSILLEKRPSHSRSCCRHPRTSGNPRFWRELWRENEQRQVFTPLDRYRERMLKLSFHHTSLGVHLQRERKDRKLTQSDLAQQAQVAIPTLRLLDTWSGQPYLFLGSAPHPGKRLPCGAGWVASVVSERWAGFFGCSQPRRGRTLHLVVLFHQSLKLTLGSLRSEKRLWGW